MDNICIACLSTDTQVQTNYAEVIDGKFYKVQASWTAYHSFNYRNTMQCVWLVDVCFCSLVDEFFSKIHNNNNNNDHVRYGVGKSMSIKGIFLKR